ncbi:Protein TIFY 10A [Striga hermonthica]|uniref:Protein TIFY n=1 Tax=Striga hermonthica TaxID=68872 RepID=A0A9N7RQ41_STRHE|nr:Protein TIFY 10A [Striga hermonthica]
MDSGRFPGGRSSFSQTCALLSRYLKMNGSFGELSLALTPKSSESKETLNLLPNVEKSGRVPEKQTGQMTVFYAGRVAVFDDLPADRAMEIMALAGNSGNFAPPQTARITAELVAGAGNIPPERAPHAPQLGLDSDLPIARKNSDVDDNSCSDKSSDSFCCGHEEVADGSDDEQSCRLEFENDVPSQEEWGYK